MIELETVAKLIEEATQSLPGAVGADTQLGALDGWDSMGMVVFMGLVREQSGVELTVHELRACAD